MKADTSAAGAFALRDFAPVPETSLGPSAKDDVAVIFEVTSGGPHVFQGYGAFLDERDAALNRVAELLTAHISKSLWGGTR